jgi:hypothetical protein
MTISRMTNKFGPAALYSRGLAFARVCALGMLPLAGVLAQTPPPARPAVVAKPAPVKPATVLPVSTPAPNPTYQRAVQQQGVQNQLQQNAVEEQIRQQSSNNTSQNVTDPTLKQQTNSADNASQNLYRARQQSLINSYQALPAPVGTNPTQPQPPTQPASGQ